MKTILVDAVLTFVDEDGNIFKTMHELLEAFPNRKIILTGANDEEFKQLGLDKMPYEVFTLKHDPEKSNPQYYQRMLEHFGLSTEQVVYFEHGSEAVRSARLAGITTYYYDSNTRDLETLRSFLMENAG